MKVNEKEQQQDANVGNIGVAEIGRRRRRFRVINQHANDCVRLERYDFLLMFHTP